MKSKTCPNCQETKPTNEFYKNASMKDGLGTYCKCCEKIPNKPLRRTKPESAGVFWCESCGEPHPATDRAENGRRLPICHAAKARIDDDRHIASAINFSSLKTVNFL